MNNKLPNRTHPAITPDHLRRLAVIYLRQSTLEQVQNHTGSTELQRSLTDVARSYGWPDSQILIIDEDLGKSGSSSERRTGWQSLHAKIQAREVGAVFVVNISRLSRQVHDFELFRLQAALHNVLLYTDGRFINPADCGDAVLSQMSAMFAQYENRKRAEIMMHARLAKAKRGKTVSALPVGWIKTPDGGYDYDPETKEGIQLIIRTFRETKSLYQTVKALARAGVKMPCKKTRRTPCTKPNVQQVRKILTHPAYSGTYIYGKTRVQPGSTTGGGGSKKIKLPEDRWIKISDHHPAYLSGEEQEELKKILEKNRRIPRNRIARIRPLTHGLLRCAVCDRRLGVYYPNKHYHFVCRTAGAFAERPCMDFTGTELEQGILREVLNVLIAPPIEMLKSALETFQIQMRTQLSSIASERERLRRREEAAQERVETTRSDLPSVHVDALEKLEKVLRDIRQFDQQISVQPATPKSHISEDELDELCGIAQAVPALWKDAAVNDEERKEILHCLIDHIEVAATKERIDARIFWKSGSIKSIFVWRFHNRLNLIRELHAQRLTACEIREHLASGKTSTGQIINLSLNRLYLVMHKMGLKQHRFSLRQFSAEQRAAHLYQDGHSVEWIARYLEKEGFTTPSGKPWTARIVTRRLHWISDKPALLRKIYHRLIGEALERGLNASEIAREFNRNKIRCYGRPTWTAHKVALISNDLKRPRGSQKPTRGNGANSDQENQAA